MEFFKQWTICICITLVIASIFSILTPSGRLNRFYKIVISLFIFTSFLYPLKSFNISDFTANFDTVESVDSIEKSYQNMVDVEVKSYLNNNGYNGCSVSSNISYKNDEIIVESVKIAVPDDYVLSDVKNDVYNNLGINAQVYNFGT